MSRIEHHLQGFPASAYPGFMMICAGLTSCLGTCRSQVNMFGVRSCSVASIAALALACEDLNGFDEASLQGV